jgi:hypothetical protein
MRFGPCRGEELRGTSTTKGVCVKWRIPLVRALASMQNLESTEKIKPGQTWKVFSSVLGQVANRLHKVAVSLCGKRRRRSEKFTPVNQWIEQKFIADFARRKDRFRERTPVCLRRRLEDGGKGPTPARMHQLLPTCRIRFYVTRICSSSLLKLLSIPCRTSASVRQCGGLGNSVESLNISYGKPGHRVELFGKLLDRLGLIRIELEVGSA